MKELFRDLYKEVANKTSKLKRILSRWQWDLMRSHEMSNEACKMVIQLNIDCFFFSNELYWIPVSLYTKNSFGWNYMAVIWHERRKLNMSKQRLRGVNQKRKVKEADILRWHFIIFFTSFQESISQTSRLKLLDTTELTDPLKFSMLHTKETTTVKDFCIMREHAHAYKSETERLFLFTNFIKFAKLLNAG